MRTKRGEPLPGAAGTSGYRIGGHVDLASITAAGVSVTRLRAYPDKIGETINPFSGNVVPLITGNRQQRRAAERQARKRA
jgi:hypothetical protein